MDRQLVLFASFVAMAIATGPPSLHVESNAAPSAANGTDGAEFRSAYLVRYSDTSDRVSPERELASLRKHFDRVIEHLIDATDQSLEIALDRLQRRDDWMWSEGDRARMRAQLLAERMRQIQRLQTYRDHGRFPRNEDQADHAVPIFVDRHDTACAVGHLMRVSGWEEAVDAIAASNNLVFVPDVREGPLVDWALQSGLTQEEAALIQPSYHLLTPDAQVTLGDLLEPGAVLERDGIRYSNFQYEAQNFRLEPFVPPGYTQEDCDANPGLCPRVAVPTEEGTVPDPAGIGVGAYQGEFEPGGFANGRAYGPNGTHWLVFGAQTGSGYMDGWIGSQTTIDRAQLLNIEFEVTTLLPDTEFTAGHIADEPSICFGCGRFPTYAIEADFFDGAAHLGNLRIDEENPGEFEEEFLLEEQSLEFSPQQAVRVEASLWNQDYTFTNAFLVETTLEPTSDWNAGDFSLNRVNDGRDLLIWQRNYGAPVDRLASFMYGDGDRDGDVDGDDLAIWASRPGAAVAAIPESASVLLGVVGVVIASFARPFIALRKSMRRRRGCESALGPE